jgi:uncharacterized protein (DUF58 family)
MGSRRRFPRFVHLHLTLAGWTFLAIATMVGIAAVRNQAALMFALFGGMMGAMMVSVVMAYRMVKAVRLQRDLPDRAWQNQTVYLGYSLRNTLGRGACLGLSVSEVDPEGIETAEGYCVHLPGRGVFRAGARFAPRIRGRIQLRGVRVSTRFPFGLVTAGKVARQEASLVVWPAKGRLTARLLHRGAVESSSAAPSPVQGGQDEFFGLREYRAGDSPRWIHCRRSATRAVPVVREMSRPLPEILFVILDTILPDASAPSRARRERALRFAATLIDLALHRGYQVGLALAYRDKVAVHPPAAGRGHRTALLDALADVDDNRARRIDETIQHLRRGLLRQAQVIVVTSSGGLDAGSSAAVGASCRHLTVLGEDQLDRVFQDDPLCAAEDLPCP